jgi:uncharacterized membrane protein
VEDIAKLFGLGIVGVIGDIVLTNAGKKDVAFYLDIIVLVLGGLIVVPRVYRFFTMTISTFSL